MPRSESAVAEPESRFALIARAGWTVVLLVGAGWRPLAAQGEQAEAPFPYQASVQAPEAIVRCGPGKNYYPTSKLSRGDRVTVRRHDPDGWIMIEPPPGSFSLIRADDVQVAGNSGTVKRLDQGQAMVRVGSALDPTEDSIFQRRLFSGERVEILGDVLIPRTDKTVLMLKIRPPRGEYRWIEQSALSAPGAPRQQEPGDGPIAKDDASGPRPAAAPATAAIGRAQAPPTFDANDTLEQIDRQFRDMVRQSPQTWNLGQIDRAYRELDAQTGSAAVRSQIQMRYSALQHYVQMKSQYDISARLAAETSRRDADVAAAQGALGPQNTRRPIGGLDTGALGPHRAPGLPMMPTMNLPLGPSAGNGPAPGGGVAPGGAADSGATAQPGTNLPDQEGAQAAPRDPFATAGPTRISSPDNWGSGNASTSPRATPGPANAQFPATAPPKRIRPPGGPELDGAGYVQRAATPIPGGAQHVLLDSTGRILAYLLPDRGVSLDGVLGRPMGIIGPRSYRADLQTDLIIVRQMIPVRIIP